MWKSQDLTPSLQTRGSVLPTITLSVSPAPAPVCGWVTHLHLHKLTHPHAGSSPRRIPAPSPPSLHTLQLSMISISPLGSPWEPRSPTTFWGNAKAGTVITDQELSGPNDLSSQQDTVFCCCACCREGCLPELTPHGRGDVCGGDRSSGFEIRSCFPGVQPKSCQMETLGSSVNCVHPKQCQFLKMEGIQEEGPSKKNESVLCVCTAGTILSPLNVSSKCFLKTL